MTIADTILFGMLAGIITLKVALLAAAAVLFVYGLTRKFRQLEAPPATAAVMHPGQEVRA
jgi:hypothetical protein